ncbi:MAG: hypothetical protein NTX59_13635 [Elusimicrobia bacterium]|nr:hypothetical protein [Elusimicrobiota bacterium]
MLTKGAVEDIIMLHLSRPYPGGAAPVSKKIAELGKKVFLSDWEMRRLFKPGARAVTVPANAIISPMALDWLEYNGIEIVRG